MQINDKQKMYIGFVFLVSCISLFIVGLFTLGGYWTCYKSGGTLLGFTYSMHCSKIKVVDACIHEGKYYSTKNYSDTYQYIDLDSYNAAQEIENQGGPKNPYNIEPNTNRR